MFDFILGFLFGTSIILNILLIIGYCATKKEYEEEIIKIKNRCSE